MIYTTLIRLYSLGSFDVPKGAKIKITDVDCERLMVDCETYAVGEVQQRFMLPVQILSTFCEKENEN